MRSVFAAAAAAGAMAATACFNPSYPQGLECGAEDECPPGQSCDQATGRCVVEDEADAGTGPGGDPDAGADAAAPDAAAPDAADPDAADPDPDEAALASDDSIDFGPVEVGSAESETASIENEGDEASGEIALSLEGENAELFALAEASIEECALGLGPGDACSIEVEFEPEEGIPAEAVVVASADPGGTVEIPVEGEGIEAELPFAFEEVELPCGQPADQVAVGDFGSPTLVGANRDPSRPLMWICDADGNESVLDLENQPTDLLIADLFGGAIPEIVVPARFGTAHIAAVDEEFNLVPRTLLEVPEMEGPTFAGALSNGDLVFSSGPGISVMEQTEEGEFEHAFSNTSVAPAETAIFADTTGDGEPDAARVSVDADALSWIPADYADEFLLEAESPSGAVTAIRDDVDAERPGVVVDLEDGAALFPNEGGRLADPIGLPIAIVGPLAAGDVTGDGQDELIGLDPSRDRIVLYVFGDDGPELAGEVDLEAVARSITVGVMTGSGSPEILIATGDRVLVFRVVEP